MAKNKKCGKNTKSKGDNIEKRKLLEADLDGQVYGIVETALGSRFFTVNCLDSVTRRCRVRSKRMRINKGDCIIVALRDFDEANGDIIHKYDSEEVRKLQRNGIIPNSDVIGVIKDEDEVEEEDAFVFEDI
jgi:initiation factor 1A